MSGRVPPAVKAAASVATEDDQPLAEIHVDAEVVRRAKLARDLRFHTRQVPALRLLGIVLLVLLLWLHQRALPAAAPPGHVAFALAMLGYASVSWLLLARFYPRVPRVHLGELFLAIDVLWFAGAVYFSGGSASWLFFILLLRVADQAATNFGAVLRFAHLAPLAYLAVLMLERHVLGRAIAWPVELVKLAALYLSSIYIASTSRTVELLRRRGTRAIRDARALIERLRLQARELELARARSEQLSRAKSELFANLSHELRTPLATAMGFVDLVLDSELDAEQRDYLEKVWTANRNLHVMLGQLLDLAQLESNSLTLARVALDARAVARAALEAVEPLARNKGLSLEADLGASPAPKLEGDPVRLQQVLRNLLDNAVKFTDAGGVSLRLTAGPDPAHPRELVFTVTDSGIGIDPALHARLFELSQLDGSSRRKHGGIGVGLAISRRLVETMGGNLSVDSAPGRGSRFQVALPLR